MTRLNLTAILLFTFSSFMTQAASLYSDADLNLAKVAIATAGSSPLAWDLVESLTTEVGPRPAGSSGDAAAVAWAVTKLKTMGFDRVWTEPVRVTAWKRGPAHAEVIAPFAQQLSITALGGSISTPQDGIKAAVEYYADFAALVADKSERARGKIVFIDGKTLRTRDGSGYGKAVQGRNRGAIEAGRRGALAVLVRSIGTDYNRLPHTGGLHYDRNVPPIPAVAVSAPDADLLAHMVDRMQTITVLLNTQNTSVSNVESFNVLAEILGSEKPEQIVAIGGHLDSWDLGTGAIDDGAGVAITMATLKILRDLSVSSNLKPKRTLRLVLFANEENGLDGAREYNRVHGAEKHQFVSESDLGSDLIYQINTNVNDKALPWLRELEPLYTPLKIQIGHNQGQTGADFGTVVSEHGFAQGALMQDASEYFDYHHSANDTLDKINPAHLQQNVAAWTAMVWLASQAGVDFTSGN